MQITLIQTQPIPVALVRADMPLLASPGDALELLANVTWAQQCSCLVLHRMDIHPDFFRLSTQLAGEVLQKFINYQARLAIVGDFSREQSPALRDFIRESNRGRDIFFVSTEEEALRRLNDAATR